MSIKKQLCEIIIHQKEERNLTYDNIVELCEDGLHKSQLTSILKHNGHNVSVELLEFILVKLGYKIEVQTVEIY